MRWLRQLFCQHYRYRCLNIEKHWFGDVKRYGKCYECKRCEKRIILNIDD